MTQTSMRLKLTVALALLSTSLLVASIRLDPRARADEPNAAKPSDAPTTDVWKLEGTVVDEQGRPIAGAVVRDGSSTSAKGLSGGTTRADGTFTVGFDGRRPFVRALAVIMDDGARIGLARFDEPRHYHTPGDPVRIVVKPSVPLVVHVKDGAGKPVAGASVGAVEYSFQTGGTTGPDGIATLRLAADAQIIWVMAQKSGVGFDYFENYKVRNGDALTLPAEVTLKLDGAQTVTIKAVDSKDKPLPGVWIAPHGIFIPGKIAEARTDFNSACRMTTDAQGVAVFDWLPKATKYVSFDGRADGRAYSTPGGATVYQDDSRELTSHWQHATRMSGRVSFADGRPAPGIMVRTQGSGAGPAGMTLARSRADGTYALDVVPERPYIVAILDENWAAPSQMSIIPHEDQPHPGLDFTLTKGTLLHGRITEEGPNPKPWPSFVSLSEQGPILPKELRPGSNANAVVFRYAHTDAQGFYQFRIPSGRYQLTVFRRPEIPPLAIEVKNEAEIVRDIVLTEESRPTYVDGVVVEKTPTGEKPVPKPLVFALRIGRRSAPVVPSDDQGHFRAERSPDMILYARSGPADASLAGYTVVPKGGADNVKVVLTPSTKVTGRILDTNGKPYARQRYGVEVNIEVFPYRFGSLRLVGTTDADGRFTFQGLPEGASGEISVYHLKDGKPTGSRTAARFEVINLDPIELTDLIVPASEPAKSPAAVGKP